MSNEEISLLSKGLKYCPTPIHYNSITDDCDVNSFCRNLKLAEFFHEVEIQDDQSVVKCKSSFNPPDTKGSHLYNVTKSLKNNIKRKHQKKTYNISKKERSALDSLKQNKDIVIKEADKGSAVVIMDCKYYIEKVNNLLNSNELYEEIVFNSNKLTVKISTFVTQYENELSKNEIKYLTKFEPKTSNFYALPKIHKSTVIKEAIQNQKTNVITVVNPADLQIRPIIAGPCCHTHRLSHLIDVLLQPLVNHIKSYIKDDFDILRKIPKDLCKNHCLATFDVENLYGNITHELGIEAINFWLNKLPRNCDRISNDFILKSIELILKNNIFYFDDKYYRQLRGTAMGTKMAPVYATLTLGYLEYKMYDTIKRNYNFQLHNFFVDNYFRYLDDVMLIYDKDQMSISEISALLNDMNVDLKFKLESHGDQINFLDISIYNNQGKIETDIYYKATDTFQYLNFYSHHPHHTKVALPYNLARRICTIVSNNENKIKRLNELKLVLQNCNYPLNLINDGIQKSLSIDRNELLYPNSAKNESKNVIPFVSTYNSNNPINSNFVVSMFESLKNDPNTSNIFKNKKLLLSKRQPPNIKNMITKAKFQYKHKCEVSKCNKARCKLCNIIITGDTFVFSTTECKYEIRQHMNCDTENCIYVLVCVNCNKFYIGETNNLRLRTNLHRDHIKNNIGLNVSKHVHNCANSKNLDKSFKIMPFYKVNTDDAQFRLTMEEYFIKKFKPALNC